MGIVAATEEMLRYVIATHLAPGFSVLEFGDQIVTHTKPHYPAHKLYKSLGCGHYQSVDGNGRGTVTFDLNRRGAELAGQLKVKVFNLVTDFGTGEHIFDQGQFWRTLHMLTAVGGFIVFDRPSQGYPGHCFWRTDPSTYEDIAAANSYQILVLETHPGRHGGELVHGVMRRMLPGKFKAPNQARYKKLLRPIQNE